MTNPNKPSGSAKAYCDSCGELVDVVSMLRDNSQQTTCSHCGFPIQQRQETTTSYKLENVIIVEDTEMISKILSEIMLGTGFAQKIISCKNGEEFLAKATEMIAGKKPVGMVFLDVSTLALDVISTALSLRSIEKGLQSPQPIPILFFTSIKCDDEFRQTLRRLSPALYVNKESDASPQKLAERLRNIISRLSTPGQVPSFFPDKK